MPCEEAECPPHAGLDDVPQKSRGPEAATERRKQLLACKMGRLVDRRVFGIPGLGGHAGACDQFCNFAVRYTLGAVENSHPSIDHVERKMFGPADLRADHLVQDCYLLGAIEAGHLKTAPARWRGGRRNGVAARSGAPAAAAAACLGIFGVIVVVTMGVGRHEWTSGFGCFTMT